MIDLDEMIEDGEGWFWDEYAEEPCRYASRLAGALLSGDIAPSLAVMFDFLFGRNLPLSEVNVSGKNVDSAHCCSPAVSHLEGRVDEDACVAEQLIAMYFDLADGEIKPEKGSEDVSES